MVIVNLLTFIMYSSTLLKYDPMTLSFQQSPYFGVGKIMQGTGYFLAAVHKAGGDGKFKTALCLASKLSKVHSGGHRPVEGCMIFGLTELSVTVV